MLVIRKVLKFLEQGTSKFNVYQSLKPNVAEFQIHIGFMTAFTEFHSKKITLSQKMETITLSKWLAHLTVMFYVSNVTLLLSTRS